MKGFGLLKSSTNILCFLVIFTPWIQLCSIIVKGFVLHQTIHRRRDRTTSGGCTTGSIYTCSRDRQECALIISLKSSTGTSSSTEKADAPPPTGTNASSNGRMLPKTVGNSSRNKTETKVLVQSRQRSQGSSYHPRQPARRTNIPFAKPSSLPQQEEAIRSLNLSLKSLAKSKERGSARRAEQLLFRVEKLFQDGYYSSQPDLVSYNTVMDAWARSGEADSAKRAEQLLQRMEEQYSNNHATIKPNTRSYNTVINAFAKSSLPGSAARAKELLEQMEEMYRIRSRIAQTSPHSKRLHDASVKPDTITYNCVLHALAKSKDYENSVRDAEKLLKKMKKLHKEGDADVSPNSRSVGSVIYALSNQPTWISPSTPQRALELLQEMEQDFKNGNFHMKPSIYTYNLVISCLSKYAHHDSSVVEQVEGLLQKLHFLSSIEGGDHAYLKPNVITYSSVMNCYAKSQLADKAQRAEDLLLRMEEKYRNETDVSIKPNTIVYSTVLLCWATSNHSSAVVNAERLLQRMENLYSEGHIDVRPNEKCYSAVISSWAKSKNVDAAHRAESILRRMEYMYESGVSDSLPNTICCNAVLDCYAKSRLPDKAQRAAYLIQRMNEQHQVGTQDVKADLISYNCLLNACATTEGDTLQRKIALEIALTTFKKLYQSKSFSLTSHTYSSLLKSCGTLIEMGDDRISLMKTAFRLCCENGQVDRKVLQELQRALPLELCNQLLRGYVIDDKPDFRAIPFGWKRNVF